MLELQHLLQQFLHYTVFNLKTMLNTLKLQISGHRTPKFAPIPSTASLRVSGGLLGV
jgi:hypothetical protein